jgi:hypothetical protein
LSIRGEEDEKWSNAFEDKKFAPRFVGVGANKILFDPMVEVILSGIAASEQRIGHQKADIQHTGWIDALLKEIIGSLVCLFLVKN